MGTTDRIIRTVLALFVLVFYLAGVISGLAAIILSIFALIFLVTSFTGVRPLYKLINISTLKNRKAELLHNLICQSFDGSKLLIKI